jgi:hypothetical protein
VAKRAAEQQRKETDVALALERIAIGHREQYPALFLRQPVAQPIALLECFGRPRAPQPRQRRERRRAALRR